MVILTIVRSHILSTGSLVTNDLLLRITLVHSVLWVCNFLLPIRLRKLVGRLGHSWHGSIDFLPDVWRDHAVLNHGLTAPLIPRGHHLVALSTVALSVTWMLFRGWAQLNLIDRFVPRPLHWLSIDLDQRGGTGSFLGLTKGTFLSFKVENVSQALFAWGSCKLYLVWVVYPSARDAKWLLLLQHRKLFIASEKLGGWPLFARGSFLLE
jgi:hypothetical protein